MKNISTKNSSSLFKKIGVLLMSICILACSETDSISEKSELFQYLATDEHISKASSEVEPSDFSDANGNKTAASSTIADCLFFDKVTPNETCKLDRLDFLARESTRPSKEQIMSKVIVSHKWMADNFEKALDGMPADMFDLFASVTGIAIHANIRPAYFWGATGGIYLDPIYLWQTEEEFATISQQSDYRSNFGESLNYISLWRYSKDGDFAWNNSERSDTDVLYSISALLFHELAHARDAFPVNDIVAADLDQYTWQLDNATIDVTALQESSSPLVSDLLHRLARILFRGESITSDVRNITAEEVSISFETDGANDEYNYTEYSAIDTDGQIIEGVTYHYEDTAMLFEEAMMKIHFDIDRELAFANVSGTIETCDDLDIVWSTANRIFADTVIDRAAFVVAQLLPNSDYTAFFASPPAAVDYTYCLPQTNARPESGFIAPLDNTDSEIEYQLNSGRLRWH